MSILELGALGEFVGSIGVIATLIFLAIQVRHSWKATAESSRIARAAVYETTFAHFSQFRQHIIDNADIARIWREGCADRALNEDDRTRYIHLVRELVYGCNAAFSVAIAAGNEDLSRAMPKSLAARVRNDPGVRTVWQETRSELIATESSLAFTGAVDEEIKNLTDP